MSSSRLSIAVLLPGLLGTYSDAGNAVVLAQRARWRGISTEVHQVGTDDVPPVTCDLYLLGGGEDTAQGFAISWLRRFPALLHALRSDAVTLAVCAGMQILGETVTGASGHTQAGLGLLDLATAPGRRRAVGEVVTQCALPGVGLLTGFENHRGITTLGPGVQPLGTVRRGVGNGAGRGPAVDGARTDHIIATYLHGPVLARNPALADELLRRAIGGPLPDLEVPDQEEQRRLLLRSGRPSPRRSAPWAVRRR